MDVRALEDSHLRLLGFLTDDDFVGYFTPLPLYGSGLRNARILAATSPTTCLSAPWTRISVWVGVVMVMPSGATNTTGCEAQRQAQVLALHGSAVTHANQLQLALEAFGHAA